MENFTISGTYESSIKERLTELSAEHEDIAHKIAALTEEIISLACSPTFTEYEALHSIWQQILDKKNINTIDGPLDRDTPIWKTSLPARVINYVCWHYKPEITIGELAEMSDEELLRLRNFGKKSLREVHKYFCR